MRVEQGLFIWSQDNLMFAYQVSHVLDSAVKYLTFDADENRLDDKIVL